MTAKYQISHMKSWKSFFSPFGFLNIKNISFSKTKPFSFNQVGDVPSSSFRIVQRLGRNTNCVSHPLFDFLVAQLNDIVSPAFGERLPWSRSFVPATVFDFHIQNVRCCISSFKNSNYNDLCVWWNTVKPVPVPAQHSNVDSVTNLKSL